MAPTLQKFQKISFALAGGGGGGVGLLDLPIRPEELTRVEPFRVTAMNTLDGAWIDAFGRGLAQLTISGHTGWGQGGRPDGAAQFIKLRAMVMSWGGARSAAAAGGKDPSSVRLMFVDGLNGYIAEVVPTQFTLKRSKSQPLLIFYNIGLIVISDEATGSGAGSGGSASAAPSSGATAAQSISSSLGFLQGAQSSMGGILSTMGSFAAQVKDVTDSVILPVIAVANDVIQTVNMAKDIIDAPGRMVVGLAADLSAAGASLWGAAASVASLPAYAASAPMQVRAELLNISGNLQNGFGTMISPTGYSSVYGASAMSSVAGGRPASIYSGSNTFDSISAVAPPLATASKEAVSAIQQVMSMDVTQAVNQPELRTLMSQIRSGVGLA